MTDAAGMPLAIGQLETVRWPSVDSSALPQEDTR